jgi:N-glycosylase/DNA lyase
MAASCSKNNDFSKMVVNNAMVDYVLSKYGTKWYDNEEMASTSKIKVQGIL